MHRSSNPPPIPPPLVAPPLPDEVAPAADPLAPDRQPSVVARIVRDLKIGGACLLVGLLIGQPPVIDRLSQLSIAQSSFPAHRDLTSTPASIVVAQPSQLVDPPNELDILPPVGDLPQVTHPADRPRVTAEPMQAADSELAATTSIDAQPSASIATETGPADADAAAADVLLTARSSSPKAEPPPTPKTMFPQQPFELPIVDSLVDLSATAKPAQCVSGTCASGTCPTNSPSMKSLGTALTWAKSPSDAYRMAVEQEKLVFMIHVSGNFEIPGFT